VHHARTSRLIGLASCALATLLAAPARAQNPAAAEALFEQARVAMAAGDYETACARFRDSDKLDPAVGTRFNLADCEEHRGRIATAWSLFRGVAAELSADDDRKPIAEERAHALEARLPYLTLQRTRATPAGVRVHVDGVELGEASFGVALPMDPGAHQLTLLKATGGEAQHSTFMLSEGEHANLPLLLRPEKPAAPAPPVAAAEPEPSPGSSSRRTWTIASAAVGVTGVAVGTVTGIITLSKKGTADRYCKDELQLCSPTGYAANRSGKAYGLASGISFGVGVAGLVAASYLWLSAPSTSSRAAHSSIPKSRRLTVNPQLAWSKNSGFVSLAGSF
jgi:hypothetical protein